ncbi:MAG: 2Fe-2S iron-sulfur cluster-binding protein, partial [Campylobacterota bacterium]|nr:2Fe-2S iron-sulfur cluster-binding protein [Campylobacterota bacterium]
MVNEITTQMITFKVFRFNAETDYLPYYKTYEMEVTSEEVVLDILNRIKWEFDGSFSYRRSCRHGICGACAIKVNGKGVLACKERMNDMIELFGTELTLDPLSEKRAIKDMIIDKEDFWVKHEAVEPYLISEIEEHPEMECAVTPAEAEALLESDLCIQCGLCHYACPVIE